MGDARTPATSPAGQEPMSGMGTVTPGEADLAPGQDPREGRKRHRRRVLAWTCGVLALVLLAAAVGVYLAYRHLNHNVRTRNITGMTGPRLVDPVPGDQNVLVVGSDSRSGTTGYGNPQYYTTAQSDTMMIVHLAANRKWAEVVSVPRDSWVNIPACNMGNGQLSPPQEFKINEAFALGALHGDQARGAACAIKTLQQDTGVPINHFAVVNFTGFQDMVNALGGVQVCTSQAINDPKSHLDLSAGYHTLNGREALGYVRARYSLGDGSDLDRIGRQQAFMSSLANRAESELYDPVAIYQFLDAATRSVTVDSGFGGAQGLYALATELRRLPTSKLTFITMPTYPDPANTANVLWQQPEASQIFKSMRDDVPYGNPAGQHAGTASPSPGAASGPAQPGGTPAPGGGGTPNLAGDSTPVPAGGGTPGPAPSPSVTTRTGNQNICT
jgi:LCP family protein required for cell wall assembly